MVKQIHLDFIIILFLSSCICHAAEFFISTDGNDSNPGTIEKPFLTLEKGRDTVREFKKQMPEGEIKVYLRGGTYCPAKTFILEQQDSGTKNLPITYCSYPGEIAIISGGRRISSSAFEPVKDAQIIKRFISEEAKTKVLCVNLKKLGIMNFGKLEQYGFPRTEVSAPLELVFNGEFMTLARWPNKETLKLGKVIEAGSSPRYKKTSSSLPIFSYDYDRANNWRQANDIWLYGVFNKSWASDFNKIKRINFEKKEIELANDHYYGLSVNEFTWYYVVNLLEEIDEPGEWYLDRENGNLYFWPPAEINDADIQVTMLTDKFMISAKDVSYVTFSGLTLELSRENGVKISGGHDNLIAGCTIRNMGGMAVDIDGSGVVLGEKSQVGGDIGGKNNGIVSCDIYGMGTGGINMGGGCRRTLEAGSNYAINNHIYKCGRRIATYTPAINLSGVGNRVANNLIHDLPQFGITFAGNEHNIELNEIHHIALDFSDSGAVYTSANPSNRGTIIRHNFIHHIGLEREKVNGVYLDYTSCGQQVIGNVFYKIVAKDDFGAAMINGGNDNIFRNNIFVDCLIALHASNFLNGWGVNEYESYFNIWKHGLAEIKYDQPPYSSRYPDLLEFFEEDHKKHSRNRFDNNLTYKCRQIYRERYEPNIQKAGNYDANENPGFIDEANMNFALSDNSIVYEKIPSFGKIPFEKIGLYKDEYRKNSKEIGQTSIEYTIDTNVPYLGENRDETMNIYKSVEKTSELLPAIIYIHGGGWATGNKNEKRAKAICSTLVQQGYVICSIDYKLTQYEGKPWESKKIKGAWPQNVYDCKTAVRYIRKNSKLYNVDPEKIGVIGCSAGGHLALLTALSPDSQELNTGGLYRDFSCDVCCVVDMYGIPDIRVWGGETIIDVDRTDRPDIWDLASPITHLSNNTPPILVIHGDRDETIDIKQSINFVNTIKEKKLKYEFVVVKDGVHSFDLEPPQIDLRPVVFNFFAKYLKGA